MTRIPFEVIDLSEPADDPKVVLQAAIDQEFTDIVIVGKDLSGQLVVSSSMRKISEATHQLSRGIHYLHELERILDEAAEDDED